MSKPKKPQATAPRRTPQHRARWQRAASSARASAPCWAKRSAKNRLSHKALMCAIGPEMDRKRISAKVDRAQMASPCWRSRDIEPHPDQPRRHFDEEALDELAHRSRPAG